MRRATLPALLFVLAAGGALILGSRILASERSSAETTARERLRADLAVAESTLVAAGSSIRENDTGAFTVFCGREGDLGNAWEPPPLQRLSPTQVTGSMQAALDPEGGFYLAEAERAEAEDGDLDRAAGLYGMAASPQRSQWIRLVAQYRLAALERRRGHDKAAEAAEAKYLYNMQIPQMKALESLIIRARSKDPGADFVEPLLAAIGSRDEAIALGILGSSGLGSDEWIRGRREMLRAGKRMHPVAVALPGLPAESSARGWTVREGRLLSWTKTGGIRSPWLIRDRPLPALPKGARVLEGEGPLDEMGELVEIKTAGTPPLEIRIIATATRSEIEAEARRGAWMLGGALAALLLAGGAAVALSVRAARRETEAARARADFVTRVGHDLRTPLAVVRMYAETLAAGRVADPLQAREFAGIAARESARLTDMVGQVLDLSRVAEPALPRAPLDLAAIAAEVAEVHRPLLEQAGIRLEVRASEPLTVLGDSASLRGAVSNLLENAHRHAGSGGSVEIEAVREGRMAEVRVLDRGPGLPPGMEERVFERFVRGPEAVGSGAGLGLALVREAAEAHGGSARAADREGGGAAFTVAVPLAEEGS
jgi:signal transduction histidine kinase